MFCKQCGAEIAKPNAKFCKFCGIKLIVSNEVKKAPAVTKVATPVVQSDGIKYPSLWRRYFAYLIDTYAVFVIFFVIGGVWVLVGFDSDVFSNINATADWLLTSLIFSIYMSLLESWCGFSVGKWFFNLKVANEDMTRISFKTGFLRNIVKTIPVLPFIELYVASKDQHKQSLHDKWFRTVVIDIREKYAKEENHYLPKNWHKAVIAITAVILAGYFSSLSIEDEGAETFIREGVRNIPTRMLLNTDLFSQTNEQGTEKKKFVTEEFDFSKQLSAVVSIICEQDNGDLVGGSGIMVGENGLILTNKHVVENVTKNYCAVGFTNDPAKKPEYGFMADTEFEEDERRFTLDNKEIDVAILRIVGARDGFTMPSEFPTIGKIGSSDVLTFNDKLFIIGYPSFGGDTLTLTQGVMSGRLGDYYIKTSAKIDSGNSGGAALNEKGELIGIPTFIVSGTAEGLGYVVGIDPVLEWLQPLFDE
ncbi:MAG: RDD family protein [Candidatus Peribacteraceae bacterium]|nr:RDD family protein [Candidatus Peribacteraceae bacterium]